MKYKELLEHSYEVARQETGCPPESRLEFLAEEIFDFTTYENVNSVLFATKAVEVVDAINHGKTFDYIVDEENHTWYLIMVNMQFFSNRLNWGGSIRGAWWDDEQTFQSCGLWAGDKQLYEEMKFNSDEWREFMIAVVDFAKGESCSTQ